MTDKVLDHVDEALGKINSTAQKEVHVHKKFYDKMKQDCEVRSHGAIEGCDPATTPVTEGPLGSTKQLGRYAGNSGRVTPIYSHGKAEDTIYVEGSEGDKGWFHEGKKIT